jgi:hypothetical protein
MTRLGNPPGLSDWAAALRADYRIIALDQAESYSAFEYDPENRSGVPCEQHELEGFAQLGEPGETRALFKLALAPIHVFGSSTE